MRQAFPTLTVRENLVATAANRLSRDSPWTLVLVYDLFPRLKNRANQRAATPIWGMVCSASDPRYVDLNA